MQQVKIIETNSTWKLENELNKFLSWLEIPPIGITYKTSYRMKEDIYEREVKEPTYIACVRYSPDYREYYINEMNRIKELVASWPCNQIQKK